MSGSLVCRNCGADVPSDAPLGICPRCLLQAGLEPSRAGDAPATEALDPSARQQHAFEPPTVEQLQRLFPQLEILEPLGKGGMGAVYKALQPGLDRLAALKILPPQFGRDDAFAERFRREARALARLNHPNIVGVYDFGQTGELCWFLMEYVDGADLRHAMRAGSLSAKEALAVVPQICDALQYAHDAGIVHRDVKPENVLLDRRGRVKIADFGLAKLLGGETPVASITLARQVMGTPRYMAPEQMEGSEQVDHRADIYSLGVVFYELLTGEIPAGRFLPPSQKVHVDVRLDEVVLRSLEREPERRWQQASHVKSQVDRIVSESAGYETLGVADSDGSRPQSTLKPGESVEIAMRNAMRDPSDLLYAGIVSTLVGAVFFFLPAIVAFGIAMPIFGDPLQCAAIAASAGMLVLLGLFVALGLGSIQKARFDDEGVTLQRFAGPNKFLRWSDIRRISTIGKSEVVRQVGFWPGLPPRGSIISMTWTGWYRIDAVDGCWYFCPADAEKFERIVRPASAATMTDRRRSEERSAAEAILLEAAESPTSSLTTAMVAIIAVINLLSAILLMSLLAGDPDLHWIPESAGPWWRSWEAISTYLTYAIYGMTLLASVGMLLRQAWARSLTSGTCWASLAMIVTDTPYIARFYVPNAYDMVHSDLIAEGSSLDEAQLVAFSFTFFVFGVFAPIGLAWLLFQVVYLSRRAVVRHFEGTDGRRAGTFSRALVWLPAVALLGVGGAAYVILLAYGIAI